MQDVPEAENKIGSEAADLLALTADVISVYVSNNSVRPADLSELIANVHQALSGLREPAQTAVEQVEKPSAAQIKKSITPGGLISFIDGKPYQTMRRHLGTHGLDPVSYRQRFGLPADYPMVSPNYAARRSELAKSIDLGRSRSQVSEDAASKGGST